MIPNLTFRPIDQWPPGWRDQGRSAHRVRPQFRASYDTTLRELRVELEALGYESAHVQLDIDRAHLRKDGMLRAGAPVRHPGVILTVVTPERTLVLRTDRFESPYIGETPWQSNLRAITLGLADLRRMDRYGLNEDAHRGGAQYAGFDALPAAGGTGIPLGLAGPIPDTPESREDAARLLTELSGLAYTWETIRDSPGPRKSAMRAIARRYHPDHNGGAGDPERMTRATRAYDLLETSP